MPAIIKTNKIKIKDVQGEEYIGVDVVAERTAAEIISDIEEAGQQTSTDTIADIQAAAQTATTAIQAKGTEVLGSIPDSYEDLADQVSAVSSAFNYSGDAQPLVFEHGGFNSSTGEPSDYNASIRMRSVFITKYDFDIIVRVKSGYSNAALVVYKYNSSGTFIENTGWVFEYKITAGTYFKLVFDATYGRGATEQITNAASIIERFEYVNGYSQALVDIVNLKTALVSGFLNQSITDFELGYRHGNSGGKATSSNTAVTKALYALKPGYIFTIASGYKMFVCQSNGTYPSGYQWQTGTYVTELNGNYYLEIRQTDNGNFSDIDDVQGKIQYAIQISEKNETAYVSSGSGSDSDSSDGSKKSPFSTINHAIEKGFRKIIAQPGVYNESISLSGGTFELIPWVDSQNFSTSVPNRPKIKLIKGTKLTVSATETTGIYQASFTPESDSNIYKVFVSHTVDPTTQGGLSLEYNAMLISDAINSTVESGFYPYNRKLYTPVLTETELSEEGTFYYSSNVIKFHAYGDNADAEYYIPDDSNATGINFANMEKVHLEDVKVLGCYNNCVFMNKCDDVVLDSCEVGYCAKGMGFAFNYTNVRADMCVAYAISTDGFNMHYYGVSELDNCIAFNCGDDGISQHEGCTSTVKGGEWHHNHDGGITPAFGAKVDIYGAYVHDNGKGICFYGDNSYQRRTCIVNGCVSIDNGKDIYADKLYDIILGNTVYGTKQINNSTASKSTITEYGCAVIET